MIYFLFRKNSDLSADRRRGENMVIGIAKECQEITASEPRQWEPACGAIG